MAAHDHELLQHCDDEVQLPWSAAQRHAPPEQNKRPQQSAVDEHDCPDVRHTHVPLAEHVMRPQQPSVLEQRPPSRAQHSSVVGLGAHVFEPQHCDDAEHAVPPDLHVAVHVPLVHTVPLAQT
jgi:hypothetical protein